MEINFDKLKKEVVNLLEKNKIMVLATCADNRVTARSMSCINIGLKIYFQTDDGFLKTKQMKKNPNVALCFGNVQIEGKVNFFGQSLEEKIFIKKYKKLHPGSFKKFSSLKGSYVVEVNPTLITFWKYYDGEPAREFLDLVNNTAEREFYDTTQ